MRTLRCAALPLAMSKGFNPRPRISLPAPAGVGIIGLNEVLDLELNRWCRPADVVRRVNEHLPRGVCIHSARILSGGRGRRPDALSYSVPLLDGCMVEGESLDALVKRESIVVPRKSDKGFREKDIAPFVRCLRLANECLLMLLKVTGEGTARPGEVLGALGCEPYVHYFPSQIVRTHVSLSPSL